MAALPRYKFVAGDTASVLRVTCYNDDATIIDLTGASAALFWRDSEGILQQRAMVIEAPATAGVASYQFVVGELFEPKMTFEVEITDVSTMVVTSQDPIIVDVRRRL